MYVYALWYDKNNKIKILTGLTWFKIQIYKKISINIYNNLLRCFYIEGLT